MKTNKHGERLFFYSPSMRCISILGGAVAMSTGFFLCISLNSQNAYALFYKIVLFSFLEYAGFCILKKGISGVHVKLGGNFIQINSARHTFRSVRYLCDEIEGIDMFNEEVWGIIIYTKASRNQPFIERLPVKYDIMAAVVALILINASVTFLQPENITIFLIAILIVVDFKRIVRWAKWRNYPTYLIQVNESEKPYLSAEISDFCTHWNIPLIKNPEGIKLPLF